MYRAHRTEIATCPRCGSTFERTATTKRLQVYCSLECPYEPRSTDYRERADIKANLKGPATPPMAAEEIGSAPP
jgi:hypothetical protein